MMRGLLLASLLQSLLLSHLLLFYLLPQSFMVPFEKKVLAEIGLSLHKLLKRAELGYLPQLLKTALFNGLSKANYILNCFTIPK